MFKPILEEVHDVEFFLLVARHVLRADIQDDALAPLVELFNTVE